MENGEEKRNSKINGVKDMTSFVLKIIACITMLIDHSGYIIFGGFSWFNYIGRLAFPIFAFQISEGYIHTHDLKKYFLRMGIFAMLSQIPFTLFTSLISNQFSLNIFFTLLLGLLAILLYDKIKIKVIGLALVGAIAYLGELLHVDYGYWGVLVIFAFYLFKSSKVFTSIAYFLLVLLKYLPNLLSSNFDIRYICLFIGTFTAILPILLYQNKQGRKMKYFLYFFYPVHLLILYFIGINFL